MAGSDVSRGRLYLDFAADRLTEARQVSADWTGRVLKDMDDETVAGVKLLIGVASAGDTSAITPIRAFVAAQRPQLAGYGATSSSSVDSVRHSMSLLDQVTARADATAPRS